jgi:hypothetical protein
VQQLYVLRRFSSWSFRLIVSVALLVSSAGLAASLLVGGAIGNAGTQRISWQPTSRLAQPTNELSANLLLNESVLPESLNRLVPAYSVASDAAAGAPLTNSLSDQLTEQAMSSDPMLLPTASSLKNTVQRSWHTFKLAFR